MVSPNEFDAISCETFHASLGEVEGVLVEPRAEFTETDRRFHRSSLAEAGSLFHPSRPKDTSAYRFARKSRIQAPTRRRSLGAS